MLLNLRFAINEPLPQGYTVIFCVFLMRFCYNLPTKWPKMSFFWRIDKSQKQYMVGARRYFIFVDGTIERSLYESRATATATATARARARATARARVEML